MKSEDIILRDELDVMVDNLLTGLAHELLESRNKYINQIMDDNAPNPTLFSERNNDISYKPVSVSKPGLFNKRNIRRLAIIIAALIAIMALTLVVSSAARIYFYNAFFQEHDGYEEIIWGENDEESVYYSDFDIGYIPAGYGLISKENSVDGFLAEYMNEDEQYLIIRILIRENASSYKDNEYLSREEITFGDYQGIYYSSDDFSILTWTDGTYEYEVQMPNNREEVIKVAEGINGLGW